MSIVSNVKNIVMKSKQLRILAREARNMTYEVRYKMRGKSSKVDPKLIVFSAYNGKNYSCSPRSVYEYMLQDERFNDYQFVWFFNNPEEYTYLTRNKNTKVVKNKSSECESYLHAAKYWMFNFRALDYWKPTKEQVYVQCWHGTPLKRLGYDIENSDNAMNSIFEIQEKYRTDTLRFSYIISSCAFVTEKFTSAWNLKKYHKDKEKAVLEIGYPRNDFLSNYTEEDVQRIKKALGIENIHKKILLYAPTWRDNQHDASTGYVYESPIDYDYLKDKLQDDYIILFRAHYMIANQFDFNAYKGFIVDVSNYNDINDLYVVADTLITDYSSVFFDYAIVNRPMIFYMYDMEEYRDEMRGFYFDIKELPGPIVETEKDLVDSIYHIDEQAYDIKAFNEKYNSLNDGNAAKRLVEKVIVD